MLLLFLLILPIWFFGLNISRIISSEKRLEILLPVSLFGGITLFIFLLNILSYIFRPPSGIYAIYLFFTLFGLFLFLHYKAFVTEKIDIPKKNSLVLILLSATLWGIFLFKIIGHINLTGDPFIYQTIGKSFTRGNFPISEPWEPDMKLSYHYGPSIFLGVFHKIFGLSFDLVQRSTSFLIVLMLSQFLIWMFKRHATIKSLILYQLIPLISLICLGNWIITLPLFPFQLPQNFTGIIDWISKLPTAHMNFGTYGGAVVALDGLMYFYHELIGVISFVWILWISFTYDKNRRLLSYFILMISIAATAIINEIFLPMSISVSLTIIFFREFPFNNFLSIKNVLITFGLTALLIILIIFEGGTVTEAIFGKKSEYPTIQVLPDKKNIFVLIDKSIPLSDYTKQIISLENYQRIQQSALLFPPKKEWLPFRWFHPGFIFFYTANLIICFTLYIYKQEKRLLLCATLLLSAILATLFYNLTYIIGNNSSRFLAFTYTFLGTNLVFFLIWVLEFLAKKGKYVYLSFALVIIAWLSIPSILPSLVQQLIPKEPQNRLILQESDNLTPTLDWISKNLPYNARVINLVSGGYNGATLAKIGIFTPTWTNKYRAYTMDGSPEYFDLLYTLNPSLIKDFKITHFDIDYRTFSKLPEIRQRQIESSDYFPLLFNDNLVPTNWERVYQITDKYLTETKDLGGTFKEMSQIIPKNAKIYIDKQNLKSTKNLNLWYSLRRALIFSLKDRNLYYEYGLPSGNNEPYVHVEARISGNQPSKSIIYDYLALYNETKPETVCDCKAEIVWKGFEDNIVIWRVLK